MRRLLVLLCIVLCLCGCSMHSGEPTRTILTAKLEELPCEEPLESIRIAAETAGYNIQEQGTEADMSCILVYESSLIENSGLTTTGWDMMFCEYKTSEMAETCFEEYKSNYADGLLRNNVYMQPTPYGLFVCYYKDRVIGHGVIDTAYSDKVVEFLYALSA